MVDRAFVRAIDWMGRHSRSGAAIILAGVVAAIAAIDAVTATDLSLWVFYFLPVVAAAWFLGEGMGVALSLCAMAAWGVTDVYLPAAHEHPFVHVWNGTVHLGAFLVAVRSASRLRSALESERSLARVDHLTGTPNRRAFFESAEAEVRRSRRTGRPITIAYLDVDGFKSVNDRFGHTAGDQILRAVGRTILMNLRGTDRVARMGGDEFAILLAETGSGVGQRVVQKVHDSLAGLARTRQWPVGFSVGSVSFERPPITVDEMVNRADRLMYEAKRGDPPHRRHEALPARPFDQKPWERMPTF